MPPKAGRKSLWGMIPIGKKDNSAKKLRRASAIAMLLSGPADKDSPATPATSPPSSVDSGPAADRAGAANYLNEEPREQQAMLLKAAKERVVQVRAATTTTTTLLLRYSGCYAAATAATTPPAAGYYSRPKQLFDNPSAAHVLEYLTATRGLSKAVLRKYGVGCKRLAFRGDSGEWDNVACVTFPWIMARGALADQQDALGAAADVDAAAEAAGAASSDAFLTCRVKSRALDRKGWQRLEPAGGAWGLFGLHTVPEDATSVVLTEGEYVLSLRPRLSARATRVLLPRPRLASAASSHRHRDQVRRHGLLPGHRRAVRLAPEWRQLAAAGRAAAPRAVRAGVPLDGRRRARPVGRGEVL